MRVLQTKWKSDNRDDLFSLVRYNEESVMNWGRRSEPLSRGPDDLGCAVREERVDPKEQVGDPAREARTAATTTVGG
jgi:hypothetical protein